MVQLRKSSPVLILGISLLLLVPAGTVLGQGANDSTEENRSQGNASTGNQSQNTSFNESDENATAENGSSNGSDDDPTFGNASDGNETEGNQTGEDTVEICHVPPGESEARHTINVSESAVEAHMEHGDERGACPEGSESEQIERANADGQIGTQVQVSQSGQGTQDTQGEVQVTNVTAEQGIVTFAVQPDGQACNPDTVVMFDVDKAHFEGEAEGDITVGLFPTAGAQAAGNDTNETNDTTTSETNESEDTNASDDEGFFGDENETEENKTNQTDETTSEESTNVSETEITIETETTVEIEQTQMVLVHDLDKVVQDTDPEASAGFGTSDGSQEISQQSTSSSSEKTYMVVEEDDVVHVVMNLGEVCESQEGRIVTTQSVASGQGGFGGNASGGQTVPGFGLALAALAVTGTALAVAPRRD